MSLLKFLLLFLFFVKVSIFLINLIIQNRAELFLISRFGQSIRIFICGREMTPYTLRLGHGPDFWLLSQPDLLELSLRLLRKEFIEFRIEVDLLFFLSRSLIRHRILRLASILISIGTPLRFLSGTSIDINFDPNLLIIFGSLNPVTQDLIRFLDSLKPILIFPSIDIRMVDLG